MKTLFLTLSLALSSAIFAQDHSGSDLAERSPLITKYKGDNGSELFVWCQTMTTMGYYKIDGKIDSIRMGSFAPNDCVLYLKDSKNQIESKLKDESAFDSKVLNDDFKKIDKISFEQLPKKELEIVAIAKDQDRFTQESGIATYNENGTDQVYFALWWEMRATLHADEGNFHSYEGIADKTKEDDNFLYYKYTFFEEEDPNSGFVTMNTYVNFKINKSTKDITFWIESDAPSSLNGLEKNEEITCIKK